MTKPPGKETVHWRMPKTAEVDIHKITEKFRHNSWFPDQIQNKTLGSLIGEDSDGDAEVYPQSKDSEMLAKEVSAFLNKLLKPRELAFHRCAHQRSLS